MTGESCTRTRCRWMSVVLAGAAGVLFGIGLLMSGMTQPARVIGFLDPVSGWDPTLAFVMGGAVVVYGIAYRIIRRRSDPWFDVRFHVPQRRDVDPQLVAGAAVFGIGWGLGGYCPGPALVSAGSATTSVLVFAVAMLAGMVLQSVTSRGKP